MMRLTAAVFVLLLLAGTLLPGCSKDALLRGYDAVVQAAGNLGLTSDEKLQGERDFGGDRYTGTYRVDYVNFTGDEGVFGGTAIERKNGEALCLRCTIDAEQGQASLIWNYGSGEPVALLEGEGEYSDTVYLTPGSNYFNLVLEDFTGHVELTASDPE